jgi:hypothetical protein
MAQHRRLSRTERLSLAGIVVAALTLAGGYATSAWWPLAPAIVLLGGLWVLQQLRGSRGASSAGLALALLAAAAGHWLGMGLAWAFVGVVAALSAWDLDAFEQHLRQAGQVQGRPEMERRHLLRLALADTVSLLLGAVTLLWQVRFSFLVALFLGALVALGTGELIVYLRQGREG